MWPSPSSCLCWCWLCSSEAFTSTSPSECLLLPLDPQPHCHPPDSISSHRLQGKPALQLPLSGSHPYDHITVESAFDNPTYETGVSTDPHTLPARSCTLGTRGRM